ncbi:MAG: cytochrome c biogenesis protein ResB [Verrucomicrobia bacterium]|nr:cytochrome c biogenesis protein ResB [Verrucomicrobiota bacterium]
MLDRVASIFTSLRFTVVLLGASLVLVFVGTLAQVHEGLYDAQTRYFKSWFVWGPMIAHKKWPIGLPGGYLLGTLLVANLVAAHFKRFKFDKKQTGIVLVHGGLVLLLVGQLATDMFQIESNMRLTEGQAKNFSESSSHNELVVIDKSDSETDQVVSILDSVVARKGEIRHADLPFTLRVKEYFPNSEPRARPPVTAHEPAQAARGIAERFRFVPTEVTKKMDDKNIPTAIIEVVTEQSTLGSWVVSSWATEESLLTYLQRQWNSSAGPGLGDRLVSQLAAPQEFEAGGRKYEIALRPVRFYYPHRIQLVDFRHDKYRGTEIPKNFSSQVRLTNPATGEDREVKIYMNNPLRYAGATYYQASFDQFDPRVTVLQVVRNPSWLTPYFACGLMTLGLCVQFLTHLVGFALKRKAA